MVKIGTVWDEAVDAARGRARIILPIAAFALFLPSVIQTGVQSYVVTPGGVASPGMSGGVGLLSILLMVLTLWGALAITAVTSHPDTTGGDASRQATARVLPLIGVWLVLGLAATVLVVPIIIMLVAAGFDFQQAAVTPGYQPQINGALGLAAILYGFVMVGVFFWLLGRLLPLVPVVLHERRGLGAIGRAFRLTDGMGGRLAGVIILYAVIVAVASFAVTAVLGLMFRLLLGADDLATAIFLGGVAGAAVSTMLGVLSYSFVSRLYAGLTGRDLRAVFEDAPAR